MVNIPVCAFVIGVGRRVGEKSQFDEKKKEGAFALLDVAMVEKCLINITMCILASVKLLGAVNDFHSGCLHSCASLSETLITS